ncbi:MAG: recombination regulator RecX [Clostridium sp.]|nr:recombination regulator RecX [Clostridium sp.]
MTVTKITEVSKSRVKIETDEVTAFVLYKGEARAYGLKEGQEVSVEAYHEIMGELLPKRAKLRALNLLKSRSYTEAQLRDKLKAGGYPEAIIEKAMAYAGSFGYINDRSYALDFIEYNKKAKSKKRIFLDLRRKGISGDIIEEAWQEAAADSAEELEKEQILRLIAKKNFSAQTATLQEKQKMTAFLYRKGFGIDMIRNALLLDITSF